MLILFYTLLMLREGCCTDVCKLGTKTVTVGQNVTLTCHRETFQEDLYWIRLVSGNWPEFLGGQFSFDHDGVIKTPHITAKQEKQTFILHINQVKLSDTGLYYCFEFDQFNMKFLKGEFLRVKGPKPDPAAVIQTSPLDPVRPGEPVTLNCSVFSDSEMKTCPADHSVYWFRAGSDESHPSLIYAHRNISDECNSSPEARSAQKCFYSFSKTVSSTDAGTYYCAVATCGQILFGNGPKLEIKASNLWDLQKANMILYLLCAALTTSFIVIVFLIRTIKKKTCSCCKDAVTTCSDQQIQERGEDSLVYAAAAFSKRKAGRRHLPTTEETVYSDVSVQ